MSTVVLNIAISFPASRALYPSYLELHLATSTLLLFD
jgi:hypothetical protein